VRGKLLVVALAATVALSGCAALDGSDADPAPGLPDGPADVGGGHVQAADNTTGAAEANYTTRVEVDESTAGSELDGVGATFPRDHYLVDGVKHEAVSVGVDTDDDGEVDRTFDADAVSGVNNNDYSFDVTLDSGYTLEEGDAVVVRYPGVTNPDDPGEYPVAVRLNGDQQRATGNVTIE
jgi:hypothetical protein